MPEETTIAEAQPTEPRKCSHCKALAIPGQVLCETCRTKWRAYMAHRKLRLDVKARGFSVVMAEVDERLLRVQAQREWLLDNRKTLEA